LMIVEKRGESKVFEGVWMCLGNKLERGERESTQKLPKTLSFLFFGKMRGLGAFILEKSPFGFWRTL